MRWKHPEKGYSDLSVAVDEIYALRAMLADEADIIDAHLGYKTFPKRRREIALEQIERMKTAAAGRYQEARRTGFRAGLALRRMGVPDSLTNSQWAEQRGLVQVPAPMTEVEIAVALSQHRQDHQTRTGDSVCVCGQWRGPYTILPPDDPRSFAFHLAQVLTGCSTPETPPASSPI